MKLRLNSLAVDCIIGDLPAEREKPQRLAVDAVLTLGAAAGGSDELADTVDYAALAAEIRTVLVEAQCRMIERAAKLALDVCLSREAVEAAEVTVTKSGAVPGLESASVTMEGRR